MSETSGAAVRGRALSRELGRMLALIGREQDRLSEKGRELPPGADWLLDNWYLIEREGKLAASELRRAGRLRASGGSASSSRPAAPWRTRTAVPSRPRARRVSSRIFSASSPSRCVSWAFSRPPCVLPSSAR